MNLLAEIVTDKGSRTLLQYDFTSRISDLAIKGALDCVIFATEDGFSPLGAARHFLAEDLYVSEQSITAIAHWNRSENPAVTLVAIRSRNPHGLLKGIILAPCETSVCYLPYKLSGYGHPYRDFYYNVSYEAISHACLNLGARKLGITHLSASQNFHEDIATCNAEALAHYLEDPHSLALESFAFVGCCIELHHLHAMRRLNAEGGNRHKTIALKHDSRDGFDLVTLDFDSLGNRRDSTGNSL